jgi:FkbM family methyltransferase
MITVKRPIKTIARRLLSDASYEDLAVFYSNMRRGFDEQKGVREILWEVQQARINRVISQCSRQNGNFFFIQVGSCDGKTGDPIYEFVTRFGWHGILVEPVKHLFEKLLVTYADREGLCFENVAIAKESDSKTIYRITSVTKNGSVPWYERSSSFNKQHLLRQLDTIRRYLPTAEIVEEQVSCRPLGYLIDKYNVQAIDLLHIDAEGYDYKIIKMVPFGRIKPRMIFYESEHLSPADKIACEKMLIANGYKLIRAKDTFAYLPPQHNRRKAAA